ncbi:hypothetical protein [Kitasatospora griseola]|nr:hypothetical protein [Kitasatospora griseola]
MYVAIAERHKGPWWEAFGGVLDADGMIVFPGGPYVRCAEHGTDCEFWEWVAP